MMMNKEVEEVLGDFDPLVVHRRDGKSGLLVSVKPFKMIAHKGIRFYEYPVGSSNLWFENRKFAGRLSDSGEPIQGKEHEKWVAPSTHDQKIGRANDSLKQENVKLMAEISAIKKEKEVEMFLKKEHGKQKHATVKK